MIQVTKIISVFFCISLTFSCKYVKIGNSSQEQISNLLSGYWIPKDIKWGGDSKDTSDVFRTASFYTLCFDSAGKFMIFASTQRYPRDYNDSIIFAGEPIVKVFKGSWNSVDTLLDVSYKIAPEGSTHADNAEKHEHIILSYYSKDTLLLFKGKFYERTKKYDRMSLQTLDAYKKNY